MCGRSYRWTRSEAQNGDGLGCLRGYSLPECLWPIISPVSILGWTQGPPWYMNLSIQMDSSVKVSGSLAGHIMGWHPSFLWTLRTFSMPVWARKSLLTTRMWKMWSLCLSLNQGPMLLLVSYLEVLAGAGCSCSAWGPSISYLLTTLFFLKNHNQTLQCSDKNGHSVVIHLSVQNLLLVTDTITRVEILQL